MEDMENEIEQILAEEKEESEVADVAMNNHKSPKNEKKKSSTGKKVLIVLLSILLALLLVVLGVLIYVDHMLGLINFVGGTVPSMNHEEMESYLSEHQETTNPDFTGEVLDPNDVEWNNNGDVMNSENVINIMLLGQDRRPGETRARSDAMILCSFHKNTKELTLVSFMRDMYVSIPGYSAHKMNSAFAWGGMSLLTDTVRQNFGVEIDGCFAVDFDSFEEVIDTIGGVDIYLTSSEASYLNGNFNTWCTEGVNHLNGYIALQYSRIRYIGNADFGRTARQRAVINAIIQQCKTLSLPELNNLMQQVLPLLSTNMEKSTILGYATELLPMLSGITINDSVRIPADGTYNFAWVSEMSVLMPDFEANRQILQEIISE